MTKTAKKKTQRQRHAELTQRLEAEARQYHSMWCNPAEYRRYLQRELAKNIATMRAEAGANQTPGDLIAWLIQFETWREENGRPIADCRRAPAPEAEAEAA